jgi:hypothetical protein
MDQYQGEETSLDVFLALALVINTPDYIPPA